MGWLGAEPTQSFYRCLAHRRIQVVHDLWRLCLSSPGIRCTDPKKTETAKFKLLWIGIKTK
jgi:hypothetical protein